MDNDFKRQTPRPFGQQLRPLQPSSPRPVNSFRPMPMQPRPAAQQAAAQPLQQPQQPITPAAAPLPQVPAQQHVQTPPQATFTPAPPVQQLDTPEPQANPKNTQPAPLSFEPPKKSKKSGKIKRIILTVLPITIIIAAIIGGVLYIGNTGQKVNEQAKQITTLESQLRSAQQTNLDLNRQIATLPGITIGLTQAEQNNVIAAITSGTYAAIKPFFIENTLVILAGSDGIGRRTPEQTVKDLDYLSKASQPWNFALDTETLDNYRDGDYAQYFPEGAIIGKSADGKVVSLSTTTTGQISVVFMAPDESLL